MARRSPTVDSRSFSDLRDETFALLRQYTPEWHSGRDDEVGGALAAIFAHLSEGLLTRINRSPQLGLYRFLEMLGVTLLPARPSRVGVRITLVPGTARALQVPVRTQVSADADDGPLPFETTMPLRAVPGELLAIVGTDPQRDRIFLPPAGFLSPPVGARPAAEYRLATFAAEGRTAVQLEQVSGLEARHHLLLKNKQLVRIEGIDGTIVAVQPPLDKKLEAGDSARRVDTFAPFDGIDVQEHALYLSSALPVAAACFVFMWSMGATRGRLRAGAAVRSSSRHMTRSNAPKKVL